MSQTLRLIAAKKTEADCRLVMDWRNDAHTLAMFYHSRPKRWASFLKEYRQKYFKDKKFSPRFAVYQGRKIAFLRFAPYAEIEGLKNAVELDINLDPAR